MRAEHLLISLVGLLFGFLLIFGGIALFLVPHLSFLTNSVISFAHFHLDQLTYIGMGVMVFGILLLTMFFLFSRRRYLLLKMGGVEIEDKVFAQIAKERLKSLYPQKLIDCEVIVHRKKNLEIVVNLASLMENLSIDEKEKQLERVEIDLAYSFRKFCGLDREFILKIY